MLNFRDDNNQQRNKLIINYNKLRSEYESLTKETNQKAYHQGAIQTLDLTLSCIIRLALPQLKSTDIQNINEEIEWLNKERISLGMAMSKITPLLFAENNPKIKSQGTVSKYFYRFGFFASTLVVGSVAIYLVRGKYKQDVFYRNLQQPPYMYADSFARINHFDSGRDILSIENRFNNISANNGTMIGRNFSFLWMLLLVLSPIPFLLTLMPFRLPSQRSLMMTQLPTQILVEKGKLPENFHKEYEEISEIIKGLQRVNYGYQFNDEEKKLLNTIQEIHSQMESISLSTVGALRNS